MPSNLDSLKPIHRDLLSLINTLCYEGLPDTQMACVDQNDRRLTMWMPETYGTRFVLPYGVPEPILLACFAVMSPDQRHERWGRDGFDLKPAIEYLIDRGLLQWSQDTLPVSRAFRNYFDDSEVFLTVRLEENENGRFCVWQTPSSTSVVTGTPGRMAVSSYRVFKLTDRAHEWIEENASTREAAPESLDSSERPSIVRARQIYEWALSEIPGAEDMTYAELHEAIMNHPQSECEGLPDSWNTFSAYLRLAGIKKNRPRHSGRTSRSVRRDADIK